MRTRPSRTAKVRSAGRGVARGPGLVLALASVLASGASIFAPAVAAQVTSPGFDGYRLDIVDSAAVVVATTLSIPSGTSVDPAGLEGLTYTVAEAHRIALDRIPGVLEVQAQATRWSLEWTVLSTPDAAARVLLDLRSADVMLSGLRDAIEAARARFAFTATTPTFEVDLEAARLFAGVASAWSRRPGGTPETVGAIGSDAARDRWVELMAEPAALVRIGPPGAVTATATSPSRPVARPSSTAPAWTTGDRLAISRAVTNVWIVAAFPIPSDLDRTSLDHLVHRVEEILNPSPRDPGLIGAGTEVARLPAGDVLVVRVTVLPGSTPRWEERIRSIPSAITPPFDPDFFGWERRRFRAHLLLRDARPGERSRRIARDLLETGEVRDLDAEAWSLEPDDLSDAAERLGPPRILLLGPDVSGPEDPH